MHVKNERGFSLVELIIGMAVLGLVMAAVFGVLSSSIVTQNYGMSQEASFNEARSTMGTIADELRYATVTSPAAGETAPQIDYTFYNLATQAAESRSISLGTGADAGTVLIVRAAGTQRIGKGHIQSLAFERHAAEALVRIIVKAAAQTGTTTAAITLDSEIRPGRINRN